MGRLDQLVERLGPDLRRQVPLAGYTTLGIGGPAELLVEVNTLEELTEIVGAAHQAAVHVTILGEGSNLLIDDEGLDGLVVINRCCRIWAEQNTVLAEAGARLHELVDFAIDHGLGGLEKMAGIPGTVGGAVIGNAGAYGQAISSVLAGAMLLNERGDVFAQHAESLEFGYRTSRLKSSSDIVLRATFRLTPGSVEHLREEADRVMAQRAAKLPADDRTAGSYFKNIADPSVVYGKLPAGKLLEEAGAKSLRVGQAAVSEKHANVIVNLGGATADDVRRLAEKMKSAVREKFGIELEEEVRYLGKI
jgi:UDP-N-acetylmuramate dehydrogenase